MQLMLLTKDFSFFSESEGWTDSGQPLRRVCKCNAYTTL